MSIDNALIRLLNKRKEAGNLRALQAANSELIDFSSNDYLGLARSEKLKRLIHQNVDQRALRNGATGSRLLTGNSVLIEETESFLADHFGFEATLLFSSGYMANLAFFSSVSQKGDTVLYDELCHACIKDGLRLSFAKKIPFRHNDLADLKQKMEKAEGHIYIACESVYSMDGNLAPLKELALLSETHHADLVVDEAHSTGIWGEKGQGLVDELGLQDKVFAVIHTFGKAMGIHGASISGNALLKDFLINFARPFIYTTAPSDHEVIAIQTAFDYLITQPNRQANLFHKIELFNQLTAQNGQSSIKTILIGGAAKTKEVANSLQENGFDVKPILSPTVKEGTERIRICLHSFNSEEEIASLAEQIKKLNSDLSF